MAEALSLSRLRCAPELTLHVRVLVGVFRSVSELSGQIHHHRNKLAATHSDKRFRLLIAIEWALDHYVIA